MPYKSDKQRRFMHAEHPDIAARWDKEYGAKPVRKQPKPPAKSKKRPKSPKRQARKKK